MSFPRTLLLDNFNRADSSSLGANWAAGLRNSDASLGIFSNALFGVSAEESNYWSVETFGPDSEAYVTFSAAPTVVGGEISTYARITTPGVLVDGYRVLYTVVSGAANDTIKVQRLDDDVATTLGATYTVSADAVATDKLGIECVGSSISAYFFQSGAWTNVRQVTDATYQTSGYIGLSLKTDINVQIDDFSGGTIGKVDSLYLDGVDDDIVFSIGNGDITGAITFAAILKRRVSSDTDCIFMKTDGTNTHGLLINSFDNHVRWISGNADSITAVLAADGWVLVAVTKASGSVAPRYHFYKWLTNTWTHENSSTSVVDPPSAPTGVYHLGNYNNIFLLDGSMLIAGVWDRVLSDVEIQTLKDGQKAWFDAAPKEAWRLNSASSISSFAPSAASVESSRVGTTLDTLNSPPLWSDLVPDLGAPIGGQLGVFDPSLDPRTWF